MSLLNSPDFFQQATIYLGATVLMVPLTKKLGLGSVLGYLVAGMAIGPWGLGLIGQVEEVLHFSEFGVVLMMFLIGLELEPRRLWQLRGTIFGLGGLQVALTLSAVWALARWAGWPNEVAVVAGMGVAMSSTAIVMQTLTERQLTNSAPGHAAFAILLLQDLAVIPLLMGLALLAPTSGGGFDPMAAARALAAIVAIGLFGKFLLRPLLRTIAGAGLREVFIAFSLLLVVGVAQLMLSVGLSMALGAFLAGVLLADSEYRHELELDIEPFKGLLLGLFFIAVGMSVNLALVLADPLTVLALAALVLLVKIVLLFPLGRLFKLCTQHALPFAMLLSQVGEFAFVLFAEANRLGLLDETRAAQFKAAVVLSMVATPLLLMLFEHQLLPRFERQANPRPADVIDEQHPVIIAGFGRFGQVVMRLFHGIGQRATIVEHDPNQIDMVRRFGWKAYYGDASRLDVLEAAGAARACLLILALDDPDTVVKTAREVRQRYPDLAIIARAHGRSDAADLLELGVEVVRETFGSALIAAELALRQLGHEPYTARRLVWRFRQHDEALLAEGLKHRHDHDRLISLMHRGRRDLENLLGAELNRPSGDNEPDWH
ncbi:monovalent cation:proton antiporter-2 (CPA2) family protein [Crenobacter sp. SG2303]|uniref:Monovalent cation:proton antiporter-2 (CPA2) family protein n=1 Tax=Crenobacter oryzisoli TaxID=3056844 RepID=A0ABT7XPM3_9NEIS|nr:monovalent cation:proton antiporter-2 (CPA2) family protein [Crenobacter sp. SG2303]MDN0075726.1 monovalent cation:proton antiporter-2 (CPA2) family protein [Crenobacter sp. SG2303]